MNSENIKGNDLSDFQAKLNINAAEFKPRSLTQTIDEVALDKNEIKDVHQESSSQTVHPQLSNNLNGANLLNASLNSNGYGVLPFHSLFSPNNSMNINQAAQYLYYTQNSSGPSQQPYFQYGYPNAQYIDYSLQNNTLPVWFVIPNQNNPVHHPTTAINTNQLSLPQSSMVSSSESTMNMCSNDTSSNMLSPASLSPGNNNTALSAPGQFAVNHISPTPNTCTSPGFVMSPDNKTTTILSFNLTPLYRNLQNNPATVLYPWQHQIQNKLSNQQFYKNTPEKDISKMRFNTGNKEDDKSLNALVKSINPTLDFHFQTDSKNTRFFVIKSFSETNIHVSLKYGVWCSTPGGLDTLTRAYKAVHKSYNDSPNPNDQPHIYLFFSVNTSGYFCGVAEMTSDYNPNSSNSSLSSNGATNSTQQPDTNLPNFLWQQKKWRGYFRVKWLYVKDVPNSNLRHIHLEHNEGRSVTNSRDTTEVKPSNLGWEMMRIVHNYDYQTCLLDDFHGDIVENESKS